MQENPAAKTDSTAEEHSQKGASPGEFGDVKKFLTADHEKHSKLDQKVVTALK